ncbi:RagB/SusD family nutrient uptake outer membrane protein [Rudanella paleaurantiibacter]|uniref:RagB/SusD family nutrient uptake outer membrane protein n=1 Tax=Rudanella paleaurantiibacter TaxID=2614655 RepID=A0A7J5U4Z0_9BACT|nr:RagB/SusD family nutrient uptake outer membrane protein [Rudanella paleaurantiibacter]KAB7732908.1 RagB/SusD family nutrient uptake outer membrane protein [Rudanella paleaurantiibacter]
MKKKLIYLLPLLALTGCELEETIYSSIYTEAFYKTAADAEKGLIAAYDPLGDMYGGPAATLVPDFSDDQTYPRGVVGRNTLTLFTYDVNYTVQKSNSRTNESPQQIWASGYDGIEKANWIIAKVPDAVMSETRKKQIIGEAYFLRAYYLWTLTKNFGDVPIKTTPSYSEADAVVGKSPKAEVYKQIYSDLDMAFAAGLPSYPAVDKGRPSKEVVNALYAKAALYNEDWAKALEKAQAVITSGKYSLMPDVRNVYRYDVEDAARVENMWAYEVDPFSPGRSHQMTGLCGPPGSAGPEYGRTTFGSMFAYMSFFRSFNPLDKRRQLLDTNYVDKAGKVVPQRSVTPITTDGVLIKKYQDPVSTVNIIPNIPILRLPDMYLIAAEAEARLNGATATAYANINVVRKRAGLPDLAAGLSKDAFIEAVLQERAWEFFAEGDRWYDLTRTGKFLTVIPKAVNSVYPTRNVQAKHKYFPIPQDELNANPKLEQNPDWK